MYMKLNNICNSSNSAETIIYDPQWFSHNSTKLRVCNDFSLDNIFAC